MSTEPAKTLRPVDEVVIALGGNRAVADLTGSRPATVSMWRYNEAFPPNTYLAMTEALLALGKTAPPASLWGMKLPSEREAAE